MSRKKCMTPVNILTKIFSNVFLYCKVEQMQYIQVIGQKTTNFPGKTIK